MGEKKENEWDSYASTWDTEDAVQKYAEASFQSLMNLLQEKGVPTSGLKILDFGCGTGILTDKLVKEGNKVIAVDTSKEMLKVLHAKAEKGGWDESVTLYENPPQNLHSLDLIVCSSVCSFLEDYPGMCCQLVSKLKTGGVWVQWDWEKNEHKSGGLEKLEIELALQTAGLENIKVEPDFPLKIDNVEVQPLRGIGTKVF